MENTKADWFWIGTFCGIVGVFASFWLGYFCGWLFDPIRKWFRR